MANLDPKTGKDKGGRPLGALSKLAKEAREAAQLTGMLPHEFLLAVARGELIEQKRINSETGVIEITHISPEFDKRVDAAKAAAPYYAPKISTIEVISGVSEDELDQIIAGAAAEAEVGLGVDGEGTSSAPAQASRARRRATSSE